MNILKAFFTALIAAVALMSTTTSIHAATLINIGGTNDTSINTSENTEIEDEDQDEDENEDEDENTSEQIDVEGNVSNSEDDNVGVFSVSRDSIDTSVETPKINFNLSKIRTNEDLKIFAETTLRDDENIEEIEFEEDNVIVVYQDEGKFLGFIPVNIDIEANVNNKGEVDVQYPWYSFMVTGSEKTNIEAALRNEVEDMDWVSADSSAEVNWTPADRAMILERIQAILQSYIGKKSTTKINSDSRIEDEENTDTSVNATNTNSGETSVE